MEDIIAVARVLVALAFYTTAYILPLVLALGAAIRMALRWHSSWRLISAALLAALPQAYLISTGASQNIAFFIGTALTVIGAILYIFATRGHRSGPRPLLEIALLLVVLVYTVVNVSWVVG